MIKLSQKVLSGLGKVPPTKPKDKKIVDGVRVTVKKVRKKLGGGTSANLERTPKKDSFEVSDSNLIKRSDTTTETQKNVSSKNCIGDFLVKQNRKLANQYVNDLEAVAQAIPEASFYREVNKSSTKELPSILDKIARRTDQYSERGFSGVIRDGVRGTLFLPDADKNYVKVVKAMEKKGYKVAKTYAEDKNGNIILGRDGMPKMVDDIDVRFGDNSVPSGYEDIQMRFEKNGNLYELLILPGPNYAAIKNKEHSLVFENFRKYDAAKITDDDGAKQIVKGIKKIYHGLTRRLYEDAKLRDKFGASKASQITFSKEDVEKADNLFKSLKTLFLGKYNALPPSKRSKPRFKDTERYKTLDAIEQNLRNVLDLYKPID